MTFNKELKDEKDVTLAHSVSKESSRRRVAARRLQVGGASSQSRKGLGSVHRTEEPCLACDSEGGSLVPKEVDKVGRSQESPIS